MKLLEKILIGLFVLFFGLQLLSNYPGKAILFLISTWAFALSYLIGGYWVLNSKDNKKYFIPIIAGLAFAASLSTLPFTIRLRNDTIFKILPVLNGALFLGIGIYLLIKRESKNNGKNLKGIFIRSSIILVVTGFFSYAPGSFKPYRYILMALNKGNDHLTNNLQMFDYTEEFEKALEKGNCESAIDYAEKANKAGKLWLGISSAEQDTSQQVEDALRMMRSDSTKLAHGLYNLHQDSSHQSQLWKISVTFSNLYIAYKCKADKYYEKNEYEQALNYYLKAHNALNASDNKTEYRDIEEAFLLNQIAFCYKKLYNYQYADSLFAEAIKKYQTVKKPADRNLAVFYSNFAGSLAEQQQFEYSNFLYKASTVILQRDSLDEENKKDIIKNYHNLIENHLQTDSLEQAMFLIKETFKKVDKSEINYCRTDLYYGICLYKLSNYKQADSVFTNCLDCYKKFLEPINQNIAENHLALAFVKIALGEYDSAKYHLDKGIETTTKNYGKNSTRYANYLKALAYLDKILGNYKKSEEEYKQALKIYIQKPETGNRKLPEVLSELANLEIIFGKLNYGKALSDSSLTVASSFSYLENPSMTDLLNNAAYVNYYVGLLDVSKTLYSKTININKDFGLQLTASTAKALNGLGMVMTAKKKYKTADSMYARSLKLHRQIFTEKHPYTAVVYLNYGNLKIAENKLKEAKEMLNKSLDINKNFFDSEHDNFADIYVALGDLSKKEKQYNTARDYYQKALDIYLDKFDEGNIRVITTKEKLKKLKKGGS